MPLRIDTLPEEALPAAAALLGRACPFDAIERTAAEKLFGAAPVPGVPIGAWKGGRLVGVVVLAGRWIRLLAVEPDERRRGLGTTLLAEASARARAAGETKLRTCDQPGNYVAPGIDARDEETVAWFERRGFVRVAENENLKVPLRDNPLVAPERAHALSQRCRAAGYEIRRARPSEREALLSFIDAEFGGAWAFEVGRALENDPPGVHVALVGETGEFAAFAAHDGNNRGLGWFGPAGTLEEHRGRGLGQALLLSCLDDVRRAGHSEGVIAWIGPRAFYERTAGAVTDRRFVVLERSTR